MTHDPLTHFERTFDASIDAVWRRWTTTSGLEGWWGPRGFATRVEELDLRVGGAIALELTAVGADEVAFMRAADRPLATTSRGAIVELAPPERLTLRFVVDFIPGVTPYPFEVRVALAPLGAGTRLVVTTDRHHDDAFTRMSAQGFASQLDRLAADLHRGRTGPVAVTNAVARWFGAIDGRDWAAARALMTSPFHLDYASFGGGPAADLDPDAILTGWRGFLPGFDHTHHQLGNLDVTVADRDAWVACHVTASHTIGDRVWTVVGRYQIGLARGDAGVWRLARLQFLFAWQAGAVELPAEAGRRAHAG